MTIRYPESLPLPSQDYSLAIEHSSVRSKMDSGRVRQRRRFTASKNAINVKWQFTDTEYQLFESFVFHAISGGNDWFEADILTGGGIVAQKVRLQEGRYKASYQSFFGWVVTASLDVENINRLSELETAQQMYDIPLMAEEVNSAIDNYLPNTGV